MTGERKTKTKTKKLAYRVEGQRCVRGMSFEKAYRLRDRTLSRLSEVYSYARIYGLTSEEITKSVIEVKRELPESTPQWVLAYLDGWERAVRDAIGRVVVFFYTLPGGVLASTWRNRPDYYEKLGLGPREVYELATHSGHYWVHDGFTAVGPRPYFVEEMENRKPFVIGRCAECDSRGELVGRRPDGGAVCMRCRLDTPGAEYVRD